MEFSIRWVWLAKYALFFNHTPLDCRNDKTKRQNSAISRILLIGGGVISTGIFRRSRQVCLIL